MSFRVVELPPRAHLCKVRSLNQGDANSEVTVYYQVGSEAPPGVWSGTSSNGDVVCAQSGLQNLREHVLVELMVVSP